MRQTGLFTKTTASAPADEVSSNAILLIRAGFINKEMAGVYSFLPLGLRVLRKIENIIRQEMENLGSQEVLLTTLQDPDIWKRSGRWDDEVVDNWFKTKLSNESELGLANTHEEALANLLTKHLSSYRDLPLSIFQIQTKFRNELRAKSGIMRAREFLMKDLYSFSRSEAEFREFYEAVADSYLSIFRAVGLGNVTYRTFASGGSFSKFSDEFQAVSESGEDTIYIDDERKLAVNEEVYSDEVLSELGLNKSKLRQVKSIEIGNIFPLGTKYAESQKLFFKDENGNRQVPFMGSYGIGLGRLLGAIVETSHDDRGIIWPEAVAPFSAHLLALGGENAFLKAESTYRALLDAGIEVLFDDRQDVGAGVRLTDADLIGLPVRLVVSDKTGEKIEAKYRHSDQIELLDSASVIGRLLSR